jgi:diacylglycerol kinase
MRFLKSVKYAWQGIKYCSISEKNFRMQLVIAAIAIFLGIALRISGTEWLALLFCLALVLGLEMINTTIEMLSDTITKSIHPVIRQVKDIAAGAVCLVSVISFIIGCIIFFPKIGLVMKNFFR